MDTQTEANIERAVVRCAQRGVVIPTFAQMRDPSLIPRSIHDRLADVGLWDLDPLNLFRISWKNEPVAHGGGFGDGNWVEFPPELTGVDARIIGLVGKWFPTGAHKVGAGFGCLVPKLVSGAFDPTRHRAVWPSTGNFCRGGAFDCALLGCDAVAILPEGMSRERFDWLEQIAAEVIATPGSESNVKEIYDACWAIRRSRPDCVIFNQFEEFGNPVWHYHTTGGIGAEIFDRIARDGDRLAGFVSATGSAGTIAAGDFLRTIHPGISVATVEALQCPTLLRNGYGEHRIEGIGDKHVPWIHNVRNTDVVIAIDDERCLALMRLFNEDAGREALAGRGVGDETIERLGLLGISGICNLVASIKLALLHVLGASDVILMPMTDSIDLYASRLREQHEIHGPYDAGAAQRCLGAHLDAITTDHLRELTMDERHRLHNLKYFTWVEQQGRTVGELDELWDEDFWTRTWAQAAGWDEQITAFNERIASCHV